MGVRDHAFCAVPLKREQNTMSRDKLSFSEATVFLHTLEEMLPPSGEKYNSQSPQPCHPAYLQTHLCGLVKKGFTSGLPFFSVTRPAPH